jgi:hypothetical protein
MVGCGIVRMQGSSQGVLLHSPLFQTNPIAFHVQDSSWTSESDVGVLTLHLFMRPILHAKQDQVQPIGFSVVWSMHLFASQALAAARHQREGT